MSITCNWCRTVLTSKCKYVHDGHLPLSCCRRHFAKFCKRNGPPTRIVDPENDFTYYAWPNPEYVEPDPIEEEWEISEISIKK